MSDRRSEKRKPDRDDDRPSLAAAVGYSNTANPWGDSHITEKFKWKLKEAQEQDKTDEKDIEAREKRREEALKEVEKAKKRRLEKEMEKKKWEEERYNAQRQKEMDSNKNWEKEEHEFFKKQDKLRAEIRLKEGRAKPVDILYKNINRDPQFEVETSPPFKIFKGLSLDEVLNVQKDIRMYQDIDPSHKKIWDSLLEVSHHQLEKLTNRVKGEGLHKAVTSDVKQLFKTKSSKELDALALQIQQKLQSEAVMDTEYWESLLKRAQIYKSKAILKEIHAELLRDQNLKTTSEGGSKLIRSTTSSPPPSAIDPIEERRRQLEREAAQLRETTKLKVGRPLSVEEMMRSEIEVPMEEEEEPFNVDIPIPPKPATTALPTDIPSDVILKKPKYFNRIQTGYDWNRYNQTHYDKDNPPPKIVKGYKFNIFYPDLVDRKAPQYFQERCDNPDYMILRFHAGPPYDDIAFKIVNKEWEHSHKSGFKCTFERGVLHLWFQLKQYKYRR